MIMSFLRFLASGAETRLNGWLSLKAFFERRGMDRAAKLIANHIQVRFGVFVSPKMHIPSSTHFPHPTSIVIGEGVRLGEGVTIYQNVTLGGSRLGDWQAGRYPTIEAGVTIFAGAVIVGKITIGQGSTIGANSVVTRDVPPGTTAVGAPARIVQKRN